MYSQTLFTNCTICREQVLQQRYADNDLYIQLIMQLCKSIISLKRHEYT